MVSSLLPPLLGQALSRSTEYAAAFFLLGGSLTDAVTVCLKQLDDFQLAVALARVVEGGDDGPILQGILRTTIIPLAFKEGNRWLSSWAFWILGRRDLAVRILVVSVTSSTCSTVLTATICSDGPRCHGKNSWIRNACHRCGRSAL